MSDVFISYSRKNSKFARNLTDRLRQSGKESWVDWEGIPLSSPNWWHEIRTGIEQGDNFVFIMSPDSMASVVCNMELDYALDLQKRVIIVVYQDVKMSEAFGSIADYTPDDAMKERLGDDDPLLLARENWQRISHINWLFFRDDEDNIDKSYDKLITTVETDLDYVKAHTRYLSRAREWQLNGERVDLLLFGDEIAIAETWLQKSIVYVQQAQARRDDAKLEVVNPLPDDLHRTYIAASRQAETNRQRTLRNLRVTGLVAGTIGVIAFLVALASFLSSIDSQANADAAGTREAAANEQVIAANNLLISVTPAFATATTVAEQANIAGTAVAVSNTEVADALSTVTQAAIVQEVIVSFSNNLLQLSSNPAQQLASMNDLVTRYPDEPQAYLARGLVHNEQGNYEQAIADFTIIIDSTTDTNLQIIAYSNRGTAYRNMGLLDNAVADYTDAIELDPFYGDVYHNRGTTYRDLGRLEESVADYTRALELIPDDPITLANRGLAYGDMGNIDDALIDLNQSLEFDPNFALSYYGRGSMFVMIGSNEDALTDLNRALELDPDYVDAYVSRGTAYKRLGNTDAALADYNQAIEIDPAHSAAYANRGILFNESGRTDDALDDLTRAVELAPDVATNYFNRGIVYLELANQSLDTPQEYEYLQLFVNDFHQAEANGYNLSQTELEVLAQIEGVLALPTATPQE